MIDIFIRRRFGQRARPSLSAFVAKLSIESFHQRSRLRSTLTAPGRDRRELKLQLQLVRSATFNDSALSR